MVKLALFQNRIIKESMKNRCIKTFNLEFPQCQLFYTDAFLQVIESSGLFSWWAAAKGSLRMNLLSQALWHMILIPALQRQRQPIPVWNSGSRLHREPLSQPNKTKQTTRKQLLVLFLGSAQGLGLIMHLNCLVYFRNARMCRSMGIEIVHIQMRK